MVVVPLVAWIKSALLRALSVIFCALCSFVILVVMILTVLGSMQVFDLILSMVGQGLGYHTEVPVTRILEAMLGTNRFGYACAMGVTFGIILIGISVVFKILSNKMRQA